MAVRLDEQRLGELRWLVVRGPGPEAFGALGRHMRAEIGAVLRDWEYLDQLRSHAARPPGSERLAAVSRASQAGMPQPWAELAAMADGARVPLDDLLLLNARGDLGPFGGGGCSDLAWRGRQSFIAHNEDDDGFFSGRCALLTLHADGRPPVTAFWKPGFVPSTTFAVTGSGLVWAIDHMPAPAPPAHPGRHFVARAAQQVAGTLDEAAGYLRGHPSAGGFAYIIGDRSGRVVTIEAMAGQYASMETGPGRPLTWHTNHARYLPGADVDPGGNSAARGQVLDAVKVPAGEPDAGWFTSILAAAPLPDGVRADPSAPGTSMTLCTFVADLTAGTATLLGRGTAAVTIPLADLASGEAGTQRTLTTPLSHPRPS